MGGCIQEFRSWDNTVVDSRLLEVPRGVQVGGIWGHIVVGEHVRLGLDLAPSRDDKSRTFRGCIVGRCSGTTLN